LFDGNVDQLMSSTGISPSFKRDAMSDLEVTSPTTDRGTCRPYTRQPLVMRRDERVREERSEGRGEERRGEKRGQRRAE
jgi:hypothetical protein